MKGLRRRYSMEYLFETEHLRFRRFELSDAQRLYENHIETDLKQWIPNESYEDIAEAKEAINFYMECVDKKQLPYVLAIELKANGELIGDVGVNEVECSNNEVEIAYGICKRYSGNGYATEAVIALTDYIIHTFGISVLYGRVMNGNNASAKVMEKTGYKYYQKEFGAEDDTYGKGMLVYKKEL